MRGRVGLGLLIALLVLAIAPTAPGVAQGLVVLRMSTFNPDPGSVLSRADGSLAEAGFDVDMTITPSSTEQMQGLSNGTFDIVSTAFDNVLAWSGRAGADIIAVAQVDSTVELPVVARPEIGDWPDLRDKVLAVDAADTAFALVLRRIAQAHGLELDRDYSFIAVGATAARLQTLQEERASAAILNPPFDSQALAAGMRRLGDQHEVLPDYPGGVLAVRRDWAAAHADDLVRYLRVWSRANQLASGEPDAAAETYGRAVNLPAAEARRRLALVFNSGALNVAGLQAVLDLRNRFGYQLPMGPQLESYLNATYLEAALQSK